MYCIIAAFSILKSSPIAPQVDPCCLVVFVLRLPYTKPGQFVLDSASSASVSLSLNSHLQPPEEPQSITTNPVALNTA